MAEVEGPPPSPPVSLCGLVYGCCSKILAASWTSFEE